MIRKTRVGKRCPEDWLLKGLEKHVIPLMNIDKDLSEELGLGEAEAAKGKGFLRGLFLSGLNYQYPLMVVIVVVLMSME